MSSISQSTPREAAAPQQSASWNWAAIAWFGALLILAYLPTLIRLVEQWDQSEEMSHGFFVPLVAGYIAWQKRDEISKLKLSSHWLGLVLVVLAGLQLTVATLGAELFLARTAFVFAVWGTVVYLGGWPLFRTLCFPLVLLLLMIPIPEIIYNQITFPLQLFASRVAEWALNLMGYAVLREGNVLELASQKLQVVEACSGIRSLLALTFLSLVYGFFFTKTVWIRIALFFATIPVAIAANAGRVTFTGILSEINPEYATGFFHSLSGWALFFVAFVMLAFVHQGLEWIGRRWFHGSRKTTD
ncbi:MAG: exosortase [Bryobacterales bacterium]|nr:exosortase [Bryobacterales bacterium]